MRWAEIEEFRGYEVSEDGRVRRIMRAKENTVFHGKYVRITQDKRTYQRSVNELVRKYHG